MSKQNTFDIILVLLLIGCLFCAVFFPRCADAQFRVADDKFLTHDKLEHLTGSGVLYMALLKITENNTAAVLTTIGMGVLWEIKDGFMSYEDYGWWGGDGFSWKDVFANALGIVCAQVILEVFESPLYLKTRYIDKGFKVGLTMRF